MHFRREEESCRGECRAGGVAKIGGSHVAYVYTNTRTCTHCIIVRAISRRGRGRVFPQHVTFATPDWRAASSGTQESPRSGNRGHRGNDDSRQRQQRPTGDHRIASHVARERTTKVIPQIQCAPCHARSLSVHGIFVTPPATTTGDSRSTHLRARPTLRPARNAHRPLAPQSP